MARVYLENRGVVVDVTVPVSLGDGLYVALTHRLGALVAELVAHGYATEQPEVPVPAAAPRAAEPEPVQVPAEEAAPPQPEPVDGSAAESAAADLQVAEVGGNALAPPAPAPRRRVFTCVDCDEEHEGPRGGPLPARCARCTTLYQKGRRAQKASPTPTRPPAPRTSAAWRCSDCPESFTSKDLLARHRLTHAPERPKVNRAVVDLEESRPFGCDWCDRTFRYGHELAHHVKVQHTTTEPAQPAPAAAATVKVRAGDDRQAVTDRLARALAIAEGRAS